MFHSYTPQAPTSLSNGPTIIECQIETIADMINKLETENVKTFEPQKAAEQEWKATLDAMSKYTLIPYTDSWWNGANIPGKKSENMIYVSQLEVKPKKRASLTQCRLEALTTMKRNAVKRWTVGRASML